MKFDAHLCQSIVPFLNAFDGEVMEFANESVAKDFPCAHRNVRVLNCVVDVADHTNARGICNDNLLGGRKLLRGKDAHMSWDEVE